MAAYILFSYMYGLTLLYGIWDLSEDGSKSAPATFGAVISTIFYTFFFTMMIISHVMTVMTSPGEMPKDYEKLREESLPKDFYNLISLRESMYAELVVKKKMRKGELSKD